MGHINLLTTFGDKKGSKTIMIRYLLVIVFTSYNILFGWPTFNELGDIISTPHLTMKFLSTSGKIITVRADQATTRECYAASLKIAKGKKGGRAQSTIVACTSLTNNLGEAELDPREEELRVEPTEEVKPFQLSNEPSYCTKLGCQMSREGKESIAQVLTENVNLFPWST